MKNFTLLILFFLSVNCFAQKEASNWYFGNFAGIRFLDDGSVIPLSDSAMQTDEGCSSISDFNGNLLFYTDGRNVWDRNHIIMPNGDYIAGTGLFGDPSSTHSGIIVPDEGNPDIYYIFTVDEPHHENAATYPDPFPGPYSDGFIVPDDDDGLNNGLNYSIVDLSVTGANGSIGDVITRNVHLVTYNTEILKEKSYKCSEKITAVKNSDGSGYWIITQFINRFYAFEVTNAGVNETPVVTEIVPNITTSGYRRNAIGCIKTSPDGTKIAIAHVQKGTTTGGTSTDGTLYLYDFDAQTGIVSNAVQISDNTLPYGVEFSAESKKLYVSYDNGGLITGLYQYDIENTNIPASGIKISDIPQTAAALQLGPNGKIYRAVVGGTTLDIINAPEEPGLLCDYQPNAQPLSAGATCVFGLPPFITSFFSVNINVFNTCFGDATQFELEVNDNFDTISWDFGDGTPPSTELNPSHTYTVAGAYTIIATITRGADVYSFQENINISVTPVANTAPNLTKCDNDLNGTEAFTLSDNTASILGTQDPDDFEVLYFDSQANADAETFALNVSSYNNTANPQTIYARIQNKANTSCYAVTDFELILLPVPNIELQDEAMVCLNTGASVTITAGTNDPQFTYQWSTGATTPVIHINQPGIYTVKVTNSSGCEKLRTITVTPSDVAIIDSVDVVDLVDNNTVTVHVTPSNNVNTIYLYSLDLPNGPYQESNHFENVTPGLHTVYVYDTSGCGVVSKDIAVLEIPKFFTPNGDGANDTWDITGINALFYQNSTIHVYDRYGKLVASVDPKGNGWNGMYNGYALPSTDYWYVVTLENGRVIKGHFSMVR